MDIKEQWRALAAELGLEFKEGFTAFLESPTLGMLAAPRLKDLKVQEAKELLDHPIMANLLARVFIGAITGFYRDFEFALLRNSSGSGSSAQKYYVNISLMFQKDLRCALDITASSFFGRLGKKLSPGRYVTVSDNPEFNQRVLIKAKEKTQAQIYISDHNLREKILDLFRFSPGFSIDDHMIKYEERGQIIEAGRARQIMDLMVEAGRRF